MRETSPRKKLYYGYTIHIIYQDNEEILSPVVLQFQVGLPKACI